MRKPNKINGGRGVRISENIVWDLDDEHGNVNGEAETKTAKFVHDCQSKVVPLFVPLLGVSRTVHAEAQKVIFNQ